MNTDFLIREENDMQSSNSSHNESDAKKLAPIAEMEVVGNQTNTDRVEVEVADASLLHDTDIIAESLIDKNPNDSENTESVGTVVVEVVEKIVETTEREVFDDRMSHNVSTSSEVQLIDIQDSNDLIVKPGIVEMETTDEIAVRAETVIPEANVSQNPGDQVNEESVGVMAEKKDLAAIPDTILMDAVEEITHSIDVTTSDENGSADATAKNEVIDKKIIDQVGHLTRNLHDSLRELGYDKRLQSLASEVPEAQDKLSYVASKTEQAAEKTLNATEIAMPIQEKLSLEATQLSEKWKQAFEEQRDQPDTEKFKLLLIETLSYIDKVPEKTDATNAQLMEIMMAQDFQDLTGQVIKKVTHMVQRLEHDLVQLLLANMPAPTNKQVSSGEGLMNGPVVNPDKSPDTVSSQDQVDDLLASLGF